MKILITGATGLIGMKLGLQLVELGHELIVISRDPDKAAQNLPFPCEIIHGDLGTAALTKKIKADAVFHLAGESVAGHRWSETQKKKITDSRVLGTRNLLNSVESKQWIGSSAIGYYPSQNDLQTEEHKPGSEFLAEVCKAWEHELFKAPGAVTAVRIGIVLSRDGGALPELLFPFRVGVGGPLAGGKSWMSWIHIEDLVQMFIWVLDRKLSGVYNAVAPNPVTNKEFTRGLAASLGRPVGPPVPSFVLKILLGEMATVALASQKVSSLKIQQTGFKFTFVELSQALAELLSPLSSSRELFESLQYLPQPPEALFPFFAEAKNLESITPDHLQFNIQKMSTDEIQAGTIIDYKMKIHGFPAKWQTLIDEWKPGTKFVDMQVKGPYQLWRHTHEFIPLGPGTLLKDKVQYRLPLGYLGWLVAGMFVRKDVQEIFSYRRKVIHELFAKKSPLKSQTKS